jgi:hypothetical protein
MYQIWKMVEKKAHRLGRRIIVTYRKSKKNPG